MGTIIFRILIFAAIIWLVRRMITSFKGQPGQGRPGKTRSPRPREDKTSDMVKDPVCGMYMDARLALRLEEHGRTVYFCSEDCKAKYLKNPAFAK